METVELPLFTLNNRTSTYTPTSIPEEKIVSPVLEMLDTPTTSIKEHKSIRKTLDELFPEQVYEEKQIKRVKGILGPLAVGYNEDQLRDVVAETQYLVASWLDDFERELFEGLTLKELLHEKGGE